MAIDMIKQTKELLGLDKERLKIEKERLKVEQRTAKERKDLTSFSSSLLQASDRIAKGISKLNLSLGQLNEIDNSFSEIGSGMSAGMEAFSGFGDHILGSSSLIMTGISALGSSVSQVKQLNTMLVDIGKASTYSATQLKTLWDTAHTTSDNYGTKVGDYLAAFTEISQYGYPDTEAITELLMRTQSAGTMSQSLAKDYILASDAAYGYQGNIEMLNSLLDSQHQVAIRSSVSMAELTNASKEAASQMTNANMSEAEITALLSTGISASKQSGDKVGASLANLVKNLQGASDIDFYKSFMDEGALKRIQDRFQSLGISLTEFKNGATQLRNPIEIMKELADAYNGLPQNDPERTRILFDLGETDHSGILASTLANMGTYQTMLSDFANADGSAMQAATQSTDSWEGALNKLSNTWTDTVKGFANADGVHTGINTLNSLLEVVNNLVGAFGGLGTVALTFGAAGFMKSFKGLD